MHSLWHIFLFWSLFLDFVNISSPKMKEELFLDVVITIFQNIFLSFPKNVELLDFSFILPERNAGYKYCHYWILFKIVGILRWLFWNVVQIEKLGQYIELFSVFYDFAKFWKFGEYLIYLKVDMIEFFIFHKQFVLCSIIFELHI